MAQVYLILPLMRLPLISLLMLGAAMTTHASVSDAIFPAQVLGWGLQPDVHRYDRSSLYEYLDGVAELYLSFDFRALAAGRYHRDGHPDLIVDVLDMGSSESAFGVFTHNMENPSGEIGQGSEYLEGSLRFWKDRYYVSVLARGEGVEPKEAMTELAELIAGAIPGNGRLPAIVSAVPERDAVSGSLRYFRDPVWLNTYCYVSDENVFRLDGLAEAVLAKYVEGDRRAIVLVVQYPNTDQAERVQTELLSEFRCEAAGDRAGHVADGSPIVIARDAEMIVAALDFKSIQRAKEIIGAVIASHPIAKNPDGGR